MDAHGGLVVIPFENSQLIHILLKNNDFTDILPQTLLSFLKIYILIFIFAQISHSPYLGANRLFSHFTWFQVSTAFWTEDHFWHSCSTEPASHHTTTKYQLASAR